MDIQERELLGSAARYQQQGNATPFEIELAAALDKAVAQRDDMFEAHNTIAEGVNTALDNWDHWTPAQIKQHLRQLQDVSCAALTKARAQ